MEIFYKKLRKIFGVHIIFVIVYLYLWVVIEGASFLSNICFFLTEPIFVFTIYVALLYFSVYRILKKEPILSKKENTLLMIISIIITIICEYPVVTYYINRVVEDGFTMFLHVGHWGN
ncbi:MAG: hypothetical protein E7258_02750 [Lachnospiraceae bacterium]|nr:hypothetical protein [Lachnospiraceae bacterium]